MEGQHLPQTPPQQSELAALLAQIEVEQRAAQRALHDFASGSARHDYITARMDRMGQISTQLIAQIGAEQALPLIVDVMKKASQVKGSEIEMRWLVGIDGTLASRNTPMFKQLCNERLCLGLSSLRMEGLSDWQFLRLPEVLACRQRSGAEAFEATLKQIEHEIQGDPQTLVVLPTLPQAVEGVKALAKLGEVHYATVRHSPYDADRDQEVQRATLFWLRSSGFPEPETVAFCVNPMNKLLRAYKLAHDQRQARVLLIDADWRPLLDAFERLRAGQHPRLSVTQYATIVETLTRTCTLVAFGTQPDALPAITPNTPYAASNGFAQGTEKAGLEVRALSCWSDVTRLIDSLVTTRR